MAGPRAWDSEAGILHSDSRFEWLCRSGGKKGVVWRRNNRETIGFSDSPDATRDETLTTLGPPFMEARDRV